MDSFIGAKSKQSLGKILRYFRMYFKGRSSKKQCSEIPPVSKSYRASHVFSLLVVLLPLGIPFEPFVMAVLCGCGILGEVIVLKDRVSVLKEKINSQK